MSLIELNSVTKKLPKHLHKFIVKQNYSEYTSQNQAVWRYVMRLNIKKLSKIAHECYREGLELTGIDTDSIPKMEGMNRILRKIGWAAVAVDGFIPPNAFMEFQAYNVLVISLDIRTIEHIKYTPAPDIIHEAAGHAPIIANKEYSEYLRRLGEIGSKAISSKDDDEIYEAIRLLSILKENPNSSKEDLNNALKKVNKLQSNVKEISEMAMIKNLHWWSVEYGLIGELDNPKIYGAGLLSSIEESQVCLKKNVKKIPYSLDASKVNFDITKPQPQLFVIPNFAKLSFVLEEFANTMSLRKGGLEGVFKLINSNKIGTLVLSTGIEISGIFNNVISNDNKAIYFQTISPTALSINNKELIGHGKEYHVEGFGSPIGKLENINIAIEDMSPKDLEAYGIIEGEIVNLNFEGGVNVNGKIITGKRDLQGKIVLISFTDCTVSYNKKILFHPSWGVYDMVIGKKIKSAYAGPACSNSFEEVYPVSKNKSHKITYTANEIKLHKLYSQVRKYRIEKNQESKIIDSLFCKVLESFPNEWLILLEMYELSKNNDQFLSKKIKKSLKTLMKEKKYKNLIQEGLELIN